MARKPDEQLVETIVGEVLRALEARGVQAGDGGGRSAAPRAAGDARAGASGPAPVRPPIGACTGNYGQFPELAGRLHGNAPPLGSSPGSGAQVPLEGVVTARRLQEAMDARGGTALLAPQARLSPLAQDLVRANPECVRRAAAGAPHAPATAPWLCWIEGACRTVQSLVSQRDATLRAMEASHDASALTQVVRQLADAIRSGRASGGVLFVPTAARALCHANRHPTLRAAPGTCPEAVDQAIAELGANVLVVEYPYHGAAEMADMVDRMTASSPAPPEAAARALAETERAATGGGA